MSKTITTLIIDMYGVILKERTGNFIPYTYEHFDTSEHGRIKNLLEHEKLFTKAGLGELSSHEFLSALGYHDTEYHMKNDNVNNIVAAQNVGIRSILFNRYDEPYSGEQVRSFDELEQAFCAFRRVTLTGFEQSVGVIICFLRMASRR